MTDNTESSKRIALCEGIEGVSWTDHMASEIDAQRSSFPFPMDWERVDINAHGWIEKLKPFDAVLWPPGCMGIKPSSHLKEKIFFLQYHMKKLVMPNFETVWHFESKVAQSFLFEWYGIPAPRTVVTSRLSDAYRLLSSEKCPLVFKTSSDAASRGVRLVRRRPVAFVLACRSLYTGFWWKVARHLLRLDYRDNVSYWQAFIPKNDRDLRITAIGTKYAFGFWRENRPRDFRASGSGRINYRRPIPRDALTFCLETNRELDFDSMAYDILFQDGRFLITEISYTYMDDAIHNAPGYYEYLDNSEFIFREGHTWPQHLWVKWFVQRLSTA
jgi:glutathione synthase/RimK-type ligase-like ATP-grasp enzyme